MRAGLKQLTFLLVLSVLATGARAQTADYSRPPVLMIHGYFIMNQAGTFTWSNFKKKMITDGWPEEYILTPSFDNVTGCNQDHVQEIDAWVEAIRKKEKVDRVDIVCHSFGCLNTLAWLKQRCGVHRVRQFVGLAGAVHGTKVGCLDPFTCAAKQMCIPLTGEESWKRNDLLVSIHGCDETPGDVMYTSIWSEYDEIIKPPEGSVLAGARNIEVETKNVEHATIFMCDECYEHMKDALLGAGGLNADGPGWACLPEECRPSEPEPESEPVPEGSSLTEPIPETIVEPMPDAALGDPDADLVCDGAADWERTAPDSAAADEGPLDLGTAKDPGADPGLNASPPRAGGCAAGAPGDLGALLMMCVTLLLLAQKRRRCV